MTYSASMKRRDSPLERAAMQWWRWHRPTGWSMADHIAQPYVNVDTEHYHLATVCARHAALGAAK